MLPPPSKPPIRSTLLIRESTLYSPSRPSALLTPCCLPKTPNSQSFAASSLMDLASVRSRLHQVGRSRRYRGPITATCARCPAAREDSSPGGCGRSCESDSTNSRYRVESRRTATGDAECSAGRRQVYGFHSGLARELDYLTPFLRSRPRRAFRNRRRERDYGAGPSPRGRAFIWGIGKPALISL